MNARFAKDPFSNTTLFKIVEHIYLQLGVTRKKIYRVKDHPTCFLGYFSTVAKKLKELLKVKDPRNGRIASQISSFELGANIGELYNQLMLNMKRLITWQNIDMLEGQVKKNLEYFAALRKAQLDRKAAECEGWEKTFVAKDTYDIMRLLFHVFFAYCRYIIELAADTPARLLPRPPDVNPQFAITPAHSTTSFIEAAFSLVRLVGFDETIKYCSGVANRHMMQGIKTSLNTTLP